MKHELWLSDQLIIENEQLRDRIRELTRENERLKRKLVLGVSPETSSASMLEHRGLLR